MELKEKILENLITLELFHTYRIGKKGKKIYKYEDEGYNKEKIESEGSIWVVYINDCMSDFYQKNKKEFDKSVKEVLIKESETIKV